jgi:molybdenum cofactor guanylyltransferase
MQLHGLVLAGGQNTRMGTNKALLKYNGTPQYLRIKTHFDQLNIETVVSTQMSDIDLYEPLNCIVDNHNRSNSGPINGILSAFEKHPDYHWFVIGCDYPLIDLEDMKCLINGFSDKKEFVLTKNESNIIDPLFAIYPNTKYPLLKQWFENGNTSLRLFAEVHYSKLLELRNIQHLESIDTIEKYQEINTLISQ